MPVNLNRLATRLAKARLVIEAQAEMCITQIDLALAEIDLSADADAEATADTVACAECGNGNTSNTTEMGGKPRWTCLSCGVSWYPSLIPDTNEVIPNG